MPQYHQSYELTTGKCICEPQNKQKFRIWWYICQCCQKSVRRNICYSETYFQYLFSNESLPRQTKNSLGNTSLVTNYRPISALPFFSKLHVHIMYNRLYKFHVENKIFFFKSDSGFKMHIQQNMLFSNWWIK